jgi:calcyclin binding protein
MVTFDEVDDSSSPPDPAAADDAPAPPAAAAAVEEEIASQSRLLDAEAIEEVAQKMTRISARMHLESLAKKLRKESEALKRVEKSKKQQDSESENKEEAMDATNTEEKKTDDSSSPPLPPMNSNKPKAVPVVAAAGISPSAKFIPVDRFSFDAGGYNSQFVTLYVPLPGVGSIARDLVTCEFTKSSFDLIVRNLKDGKSYRLYKKDDLEHDIDDKNCKIIVKADKVIVKLAKVKKGDYGGYDFWTKLTDNKKKSSSSLGGGSGKENPQDSIMNLMKDMYDQGDDNMKKMIGETMMKQQRGELNRSDMGHGGGLGKGLGKGPGGLDDMNFDDEEF